MEIDNFSDGPVYGLIVGIDLQFTTTVNAAINPNMPWPLLYGAISGS